MKWSHVMAGLMLASVLSTAGFAANPQAAAPAQTKLTFPSVYDHILSAVEKEFVDAAEAMPEDKFNFAPTGPGEFKGVRTYSAQIKHVAMVNYVLGAALMQEKMPIDAPGEDGPANITSRADVLKFLKDSFAYAHKSVANLNADSLLEPVKAPWGDHPMSRLALVTTMMSHPFDHYGQMVEYLRMNSIVPPASR